MSCTGVAGSPDALPPLTPPDHALLGDGFLNIAHRGGGRLAPEETLVAFDNAVALGADVLEMDVRATQDGVLVLSHDQAVDRTSDGTGAVANLSYADLLTLDAGYHFTRDGGATYPYRSTGVTFATLLEVLQSYPSMLFSIELKDRGITEEALAVIEQAGVVDRVILASFSDPDILNARQLMPELLTAATVEESVEFARLTDEEESTYRPNAWAIQAPPTLGALTVDQAAVDRAGRLQMKIHIWTINDPAEMQRYLDMGIAGIMTDDPETLEALLP